MTARIKAIAKYLDEVKMHPVESQLEGLLKFWPGITAEEFELAVKTFTVKDLEQQERHISQLARTKAEFEFRGQVSPVSTDDINSLWKEHWRLCEARKGGPDH